MHGGDLVATPWAAWMATRGKSDSKTQVRMQEQKH